MSENNDASTHPPLSILELGVVFFKIGMTAFGGLGASLALIHRELVVRRRVLTPEQMTEALAFTKLCLVARSSRSSHTSATGSGDSTARRSPPPPS